MKSKRIESAFNTMAALSVKTVPGALAMFALTSSLVLAGGGIYGALAQPPTAAPASSVSARSVALPSKKKVAVSATAKVAEAGVQLPNPAEQVGVRLLEEILQRTHNIPQFARTKAKQTLAYQNRYNGIRPMNGPTNMLLAIKPKEPTTSGSKSVTAWNGGSPQQEGFASAGTQVASAPAVASYGGYGSNSNSNSNSYSASNSNQNQNSPTLAGKGLVAWNNGPSGGVPSVVTNQAAQLDNSSMRRSALQKTSYANQAAKTQAPASQAVAPAADDGVPSDNQFGSANRAMPGRTKGLSPEARDRLSQSINHFASAVGAMNQGMSQATRAQSAGAGGALMGRDELANQSPNVKTYSAPNQLQIVDATPNVRDYREPSSSMMQAKSASADASNEDRVAPQQPAKFRVIREMARQDDKNSLASAQSMSESGNFAPPILSPGAGNLSSTQIALLPPNIVSGIPLVRLGSTSYEVNKALSRIGSINKQNVNGWSVWTVSRAQSTTPALHVYMRHGLVEAIRIFDPMLVTQDFGISLGDDLPAVLKRFGQPGFIITQPSQSRGAPADRHYVYPISQVSFQLSRNGANPEPRVVSLLIFTVK